MIDQPGGREPIDLIESGHPKVKRDALATFWVAYRDGVSADDAVGALLKAAVTTAKALATEAQQEKVA